MPFEEFEQHAPGQTGDGFGGPVFEEVRIAGHIHPFRLDAGDLNGCINQGIAYISGTGTPQNVPIGLSLYLKACDGGQMLACANFALIHRDGIYTAQNLKTAYEYYNKACHGQYLPACAELGRMYAAGQHVSRDLRTAQDLLTRACDADLLPDCVSLGQVILDSGHSLANESRAKALFQRACDAGDLGGCFSLGDLMAGASSLGTDFTLAAASYQAVCEASPTPAPACQRAAWTRCSLARLCDDQALASARRATDADPASGEAAWILAEILCRMGQTDDANAAYSRSDLAGFPGSKGKTCSPPAPK